MRSPDLSPEFNEENFARVVDYINTFSKQITLENLAGQVIEGISIEAGLSLRIPHTLKTAPKYWILLGQDDSDAHITDGDEIFNEKYITLKNQGAVTAVIKILLLRG